jgi:hypothetical protein
MLLSNLQIVKRTKATSLPVPDEVINYINSWSLDRKISKVNNISSPVFEQNKRLIADDELDCDDDIIYHSNRKRINSSSNPEFDENYDIPDDDKFDAKPLLLDAIQEYTVHVIDDVFDDVNNEIDLESVMYDDAVTENELSHENEFDTNEDINIQEDEIDIIQPSEVDELPEIEQPQLRRSPRGHQPSRWQSNRDNRTVGCCIPYDLSYTDNTYAFNMKVSEGIGKLGDIAVESIKKEMKQKCGREY